MGNRSRGKKVAGPKSRGKRSAKAKDLTARGRGRVGGSSTAASPQLANQSFGGVVLKRDQVLNLGL